MAGFLEFSQFVGGADSLQTEQTFPSTQKTLLYDFGVDISGWNFLVEHQTVVADTISFDRNTGAPNFASSTILGYFPAGVVNTSTYVSVINTTTVAITIPSNLYTGPILPDARSHTPITLVGITWTDDSSPAQRDTHRWALIQSYEPGVQPGDPILASGYTAIVVGV